jgi:hypothetical protein
MTITYSYAGGALCKPCSRCGVVKPLSEYYRQKTGKQAGKYRSQCKACVRELALIYHYEHREQCLERMREWHALHPEWAREHNRSEVHKQAVRRWEQQNKKLRAAQTRAWRAENSERFRAVRAARRARRRALGLPRT